MFHRHKHVYTRQNIHIEPTQKVDQNHRPDGVMAIQNEGLAAGTVPPGPKIQNDAVELLIVRSK